MTGLYYKLDADHNVLPATRDEWIDMIEKQERIIEQTQVTPQVWVSTVFLGLDHSFVSDGVPIVFETMAFIDGDGEDQERCSTWKQALANHATMCAKYLPNAKP